jgi:hypothetical protein
MWSGVASTIGLSVYTRQCMFGVSAYLALEEDGANAVEQLKRRDDVTLHQHTCTQRSRHPPASAYGHFVKPLLKREPAYAAHHAVPARQYVCHGEISCPTELRTPLGGFVGCRGWIVPGVSWRVVEALREGSKYQARGQVDS